MKKMNKSIVVLMVAMVLTMSAFAQETFKVDVSKSDIQWTGEKVTGEHTGNIKFESGMLKVKNGKLTGGEFMVDMTSMTNTDLDGEYKDKLMGHLKSDDFFGVEKHPTSKLTITSVTHEKGNQYKIKGDLMIKGKMNSIEFPAEVVMAGNKIYGNAFVTIDRSKYDVKYGSGSFFDNLGDKTIYDNFTLQIKLVAEN